jgi:hypothetical protein
LEKCFEGSCKFIRLSELMKEKKENVQYSIIYIDKKENYGLRGDAKLFSRYVSLKRWYLSTKLYGDTASHRRRLSLCSHCCPNQKSYV